jgi:hypothetical protein
MDAFTVKKASYPSQSSGSTKTLFTADVDGDYLVSTYIECSGSSSNGSSAGSELQWVDNSRTKVGGTLNCGNSASAFQVVAVHLAAGQSLEAILSTNGTFTDTFNVYFVIVGVPS